MEIGFVFISLTYSEITAVFMDTNTDHKVQLGISDNFMPRHSHCLPTAGRGRHPCAMDICITNLLLLHLHILIYRQLLLRQDSLRNFIRILRQLLFRNFNAESIMKDIQHAVIQGQVALIKRDGSSAAKHTRGMRPKTNPGRIHIGYISGVFQSIVHSLGAAPEVVFLSGSIIGHGRLFGKATAVHADIQHNKTSARKFPCHHACSGKALRAAVKQDNAGNAGITADIPWLILLDGKAGALHVQGYCLAIEFVTARDDSIAAGTE